ncbi:hypothetical protein C0995_005512 [Termitomyces sp. Mi166|nr:hypothetical protein C0995_005512 [Termitomyces sp. Mi166\
MLNLFRHVTRRSVSAARPALVAHYSAAQSPEVDTTAMEELEGVLNNQAEVQESRNFSGSDDSYDRSFQEVVKWKKFKADGFVRPHDFTYKARFNAQPQYQTRRPTQGPPPSVARYNDIFYQFDIDPLDLSMEPSILSHYVSEMGKVYGRNITGLTSKSQRQLGKAIRRAKMMGVIPILSKNTYGQSIRTTKKQ